MTSLAQHAARLIGLSDGLLHAGQITPEAHAEYHDLAGELLAEDPTTISIVGALGGDPRLVHPLPDGRSVVEIPEIVVEVRDPDLDPAA